nr:FCD domain-containing protein [Cereibacter changlensis]
MFQTRLMLESEIAAQASGSISGEALDQLRATTDRMERCWEAGDLLANVEADLLFHQTIALACPNLMLRTLYETVRSLLTERSANRSPAPKPTACGRRWANTARSSRRSSPTTSTPRALPWPATSATRPAVREC